MPNLPETQQTHDVRGEIQKEIIDPFVDQLIIVETDLVINEEGKTVLANFEVSMNVLRNFLAYLDGTESDATLMVRHQLLKLAGVNPDTSPKHMYPARLFNLQRWNDTNIQTVATLSNIDRNHNKKPFIAIGQDPVLLEREAGNVGRFVRRVSEDDGFSLVDATFRLEKPAAVAQAFVDFCFTPDTELYPMENSSEINSPFTFYANFFNTEAM